MGSTAELGFTHRYVPPRGDTPDAAYTLLLLHGTGGNEDDLLGLGPELLPSAGLLSPRGKVLERGTVPRFFRRLAEGVFDMEDLRFRTHELADFVAAAAGHYGFDPSKVIAVGYSNGANIAAAVVLLRPATLAAAALWRALLPLEPESPPDLAGKRVLIGAGRDDPLAPPARTDALVETLRAAGAEVSVRRDAAGHGLEPGDLITTREWLVGFVG